MATWFWIVIVIVVVVIALVAAMTARRRRTAMLRERFGSEYDRAVEAHDGQRAAEAELRGRERERARLDIKPLSEASRVRYSEEWRTVQQSFVDQPQEATTAAHDLVNRVMAERGYPMRDFDAQADLVSVDHPGVVENYRVAHGIHERAQRQEASTEDLREAMLRYRSLFEELLRAGDGTAGDGAVAAGAGAAGARPARDATAVSGAGDGAAPAQPVTSRPQDTVEGETSDDAR
jgi:FtsZ-interacting cell division protein ZipA